MASLRTAGHQFRDADAENAHPGKGVGGKGPAAMATRSKTGAIAAGRAALGDLANRQQPNKQAQQQQVKPLKPARQLQQQQQPAGQNGQQLMTRQRASANLHLANNGAAAANKRILPARKAAEEAIQKTRQQSLGSGGRRSSQDKKDEAMDVEEAAPEPAGAPETEDVEMEEAPVAVAESEAFSAARTADLVDTLAVEDIDKDDKENPQLACEYVNEIYAYMRQLESRLAIRANYLELISGSVPIRPKMRNLLVDWLVEVHQQFNLLQETLYLTVSTIDRFLQVRAKAVSTKQLQLVGVTAMFVAAKYEEMYPPEIGDFVYITDNAYSAGQIRRMEITMMEALQFDLGRPLPLNFLRRNSKAAQIDAHTHALAKYAMELTLTDYKMSHLAPSVVAASSLALAMRVLDGSSAPGTLRRLWTPTLAFYTAYTAEAIAPVVALVADAVNRATLVLDGKADNKETVGKKPFKQLESVGKKYRNKKFMKVSLIPELRTALLPRLADGLAL